MNNYTADCGMWQCIKCDTIYTNGEQVCIKCNDKCNDKCSDQKLKLDAGKNRMDLIPAVILEELGKVLTYGIEKGYSENSWKEVEPKRYIAAMLRHYVAWGKGELIDPESKIRHLTHLLCNVAFLLYGELNDR